MAERPFTLADEAAFHAAALPGILAGQALDARVRRFPIRLRLEAWRRANEGEDLVAVVDEIEARLAAAEPSLPD